MRNPLWLRSLLNDSYRTPLHLVYPPHVVALGCLHLMSVLRRIDLRAWLEGLQTDLNQARQLERGDPGGRCMSHMHTQPGSIYAGHAKHAGCFGGPSSSD